MLRSLSTVAAKVLPKAKFASTTAKLASRLAVLPGLPVPRVPALRVTNPAVPVPASNPPAIVAPPTPVPVPVVLFT